MRIRKKHLLPVIVLSPFILIFLLLALISASNYSNPPTAEIQALIPRRAATQSQAAAWLKSENRRCTLITIPEGGNWSLKSDMKDTESMLWVNGYSSADAPAAASAMETDFGVRPRSLDSSWARNVLQCRLYFDRGGKLMALWTQAISFGF